jgi:hypothetical protein
MWERTKRLINSYLDDLISRTNSPDRDVRDITRAEIARLNELEVQARASAKLLEKELAETELKIVGLQERERLIRERGDSAALSALATTMSGLITQRDFLKTQLGEALVAADRAKGLREQRRRQGEDLATETHLTAMRENLSSVHSGFDALDPSSTIDEMRARISRSPLDETAARLADADRELEAARAREKVDELLARYKRDSEFSSAPPTPRDRSETVSSPAEPEERKEPNQEKTLGPSPGPVKPID